MILSILNNTGTPSEVLALRSGLIGNLMLYLLLSLGDNAFNALYCLIKRLIRPAMQMGHGMQISHAT